jgi:aminoglycoside 6-adenylyltransferase
MDEIVQLLVRWADSQDAIRALILTSSRAGANKADEFSDYDIMVLTDHPDQYLRSDAWIESIMPLWVYIKEQFTHGRDVIPTRLVIFRDAVKVDFSFWQLQVLRDFIANGFSNTDDMNRGYRVLIDKDGLTRNLPSPAIRFFKVPRPTEDEFRAVICEFWFEMAGIAKYLARGDLFPAKQRENGIVKDLFLKMLIWNVQAKNNWDAETHTDGKKMQSWVDSDTLQSLAKTYSGFNLEDSWQSTLSSMEFFREISTETSRLLGYDYPQSVDREITMYIGGIRRR